MDRHRIVSRFVRSMLLAFLALPVLSARPAMADDAVRHIVLLQFKEDAAPAEVGSILAELEKLPTKIPGFLEFQWGINNSPEKINKGFTHAFVMTFKDAGARDAYIGHPEHQAFGVKLTPVLKDVFAFDFPVPPAVDPAEPGRVHHLVFFKYKDDAPKDAVDRVNAAFTELPGKVSGLLEFHAGTNNLPGDRNKGFTHGFHLSFINDRARNDYLIHPAHKEFGSLVGPVLGDVLVVDFTVVPSSRSLFIVEGLEPYAVYQRGADGTAEIRFSGISRAEGPIEARLRTGRRTVPGFDWKVAGKAAGGVFEAALPKVPAGGEYTVEVRRRDSLGNVGDHTEVANILVGDLWILAGQSNMEGVGDLVDVQDPDPLVHCFTMAHRWELAKEPLHWLIDSPDPVHSGDLAGLTEGGRRDRRAAWRAARRKGAGLGLPFAVEMVRRTGIPVGLIAAAHGGTSMQQWDPAGRDQGGATLYGSMVKQVKNAGGKVKGVLWYQGESDANPEAASLFPDRFKGLVAAFRRDFNAPDLPFYYVQIGRFVRDMSAVSWNRIQELQRVAEGEISGSAMVPVIDLPLDDLIHVGTPGLKRTGQRLARIACRELFGEKGLERGPRLAGVELADGGRTVRVKYSSVNGRLLPAAKVEGFSIRKKDGSAISLIYNAAVDPKDPAVVVLKLQDPAPADSVLFYGAGLDPVCNLVDAQDMAAPVFGPVELK